MKFSIGFPSMGSYIGSYGSEQGAMTFREHEGFHPINPELYASDFIDQFASTAVDSGFDAIHFTEHPVPSARWLEKGGHEALDPIVALAFVAGLNADIRLLTQLTILPYRNPFLYAKAAATLDRLAGGRLTLGVGAGYLKSEFFALGVDFDERNSLFDESLEVCRLAWSGDRFSYEGMHFSALDVRCLPTPLQTSLPVWIGGNSRLARQRVASAAQGWLPQPNPPSIAATRRSATLETLRDLELMLEELRDMASSLNRTEPIDVMFTSYEGGMPGSADWDRHARVADLRAQETLGVTWHQSNPIGATSIDILDMVKLYGADVISKFR
jgi:probable F420-dependent oxidoreductase